MNTLEIYEVKINREGNYDNINNFARFFDQRMRCISAGNLYNWQYESLADTLKEGYGIVDRRSTVEIKDKTVCFNIYVWDRKSVPNWKHKISLLRTAIENSQKQMFPSLTVRLTGDDVISISVEFPEELKVYQRQRMDCIGKVLPRDKKSVMEARKVSKRFVDKYRK